MPIGDYARRLIAVSEGEHQSFAGVLESDARLRKRIYDTYLAELAAADPGDKLGYAMPAQIGSWAWSATFVSWCVLTAGASKAEFDLSVRHAMYVKRAIADQDAKKGVFRAVPVDQAAPQPGDIIVANREGGKITYDQARQRESYPSHGAIVVDIITKNGRSYAVTIGGNERDSVRRTEVELTSKGLVRQRTVEPYICVIRNLKDRPAQAAPAPAVQPAAPARASAALSPALRGHGTFVYDVAATVRDYGNVANVAAAMKRCGMAHAWLRIYKMKGFSAAEQTLTRDLIAAIKQAGIAVAGWGWCQGEDPKGEAKLGAKALAGFGLKDFVADIEPGHNNSQWTVSEIQDYCAAIRSGVGGSLAVSSFALVDWHEPHLMKATLDHVDAVAPQIYWFDFPNARMTREFKRPDGTAFRPNDPAEYADLCLDRWRRVTLSRPKPMILTGQAYWGEGNFTQASAERRIEEFLAKWKGHGRVAGLNWWHFGGAAGMSHAMMEDIAAAKLGNKPYA